MAPRLDAAIRAYVAAFDTPSPTPFGISDEYLAKVLERAVAKGRPIPDDFDWWRHLPPDALA